MVQYHPPYTDLQLQDYILTIWGVRVHVTQLGIGRFQMLRQIMPQYSLMLPILRKSGLRELPNLWCHQLMERSSQS